MSSGEWRAFATFAFLKLPVVSLESAKGPSMDNVPEESDVQGMTRRSMLRQIGYVGAAAMAGTAVAHPCPAGGDSKTITGTLEGVRFVEGCSSGFCVIGTFQGDHGFRGTFISSMFGLETVGFDPYGRIVTAMSWTIQSNQGELTNFDIAGLDFQRGAFSSLGNIAGQTGELTGAIGDAFIYGHISTDEPLERFTGRFVFELNVPKKNV